MRPIRQGREMDMANRTAEGLKCPVHGFYQWMDLQYGRESGEWVWFCPGCGSELRRDIFVPPSDCPVK